MQRRERKRSLPRMGSVERYTICIQNCTMSVIREGDVLTEKTLPASERPFSLSSVSETKPSKAGLFRKGRRREQSAVFPALTQTGETERSELLLTLGQEPKREMGLDLSS